MNSAPEEIYCKYCGSSELVGIVLHKDSSKSPKVMGVTTAVLGVSYRGSHGSINSLEYPTHYCKRCRKTEAKGSIGPSTAQLFDNNGIIISLMLPETLLALFSSLQMKAKDIEISIQGLQRRLKQIIKKFERTGKNPCKNGKIGYKARLKVLSSNVDIYVLVENSGIGKDARIVYDGGRSFCE